MSAGTDFVLDRGFGRRNELSADALAARILAAAGYAPGALAAFLARLAGPGAEGGFLSRHPPAAERVAALAAVPPGAAPPEIRLTRLSRAAGTLGD